MSKGLSRDQLVKAAVAQLREALPRAVQRSHRGCGMCAALSRAATFGLGGTLP